MGFARPRSKSLPLVGSVHSKPTSRRRVRYARGSRSRHVATPLRVNVRHDSNAPFRGLEMWLPWRAKFPNLEPDAFGIIYRTMNNRSFVEISRPTEVYRFHETMITRLDSSNDTSGEPGSSRCAIHFWGMLEAALPPERAVLSLLPRTPSSSFAHSPETA